MKALLKKAEYSWKDPLVDPPLPRNRRERIIMADYETGGAVLGGLLGAGASMASDIARARRSGKKVFMPRAIAQATGAGALGVGIGAGLGGSYMGGRRIYKDRLKRKEPMSTPSEEARKLKGEGKPLLHLTSLSAGGQKIV